MSAAPEFTKAQWAKYEKARTALDKVHDCDPERWTARVSTVGFEAPHYVGVSCWTCDACRALVEEMTTNAFGGCVVKARGEA